MRRQNGDWWPNGHASRRTFDTSYNKDVLQRSFILFSEGCASVFSVLTIKQFVMCEKRLFFIILGNTLPFWDCLDGSKKIDRSNATHAPLTRELCLHGLVEMH